MIMILEKTPLYVYCIFVALLFLGWMQSRDRVVSYFRAFMVPIFLLIFSLYGVASAFGMGISLLSWSLGVIFIMAFGIRMHIFYNVIFLKEENAFAIKGSWLWLGFMMIIFCLKFALGVSEARNLAIMNEAWFILGMSLCYGLLSGVFLVRMIILWKIKG